MLDQGLNTQLAESGTDAGPDNDCGDVGDAMNVIQTIFRESLSGFFRVFILIALVLVAACAALLVALSRAEILPAPPLTAEFCIDEKLDLLREADLSEPTFMTVGSSSSWRNIDLSVVHEALNGARPLNAAPCYLYANQSAYFAEVLTEHTRNLDTLLVVYHIRDFENCRASRREFVNPIYLNGYITGAIPRWLPYVTGFHPEHLFNEARRLQKEKSDPLPARRDEFGGEVLTKVYDWNPAPSVDESCYDAVTDLEAVAREHDLRLIIATLPPKPSWLDEFDPDGTLQDEWITRLKAHITDPDTIFVDGRDFPVTDDQFADPVHLIDPYHTAYSRFVAASIPWGE